MIITLQRRFPVSLFGLSLYICKSICSHLCLGCFLAVFWGRPAQDGGNETGILWESAGFLSAQWPDEELLWICKVVIEPFESFLKLSSVRVSKQNGIQMGGNKWNIL